MKKKREKEREISLSKACSNWNCSNNNFIKYNIIYITMIYVLYIRLGKKKSFKLLISYNRLSTFMLFSFSFCLFNFIINTYI